MAKLTANPRFMLIAHVHLPPGRVQNGLPSSRKTMQQCYRVRKSQQSSRVCTLRCCMTRYASTASDDKTHKPHLISSVRRGAAFLYQTLNHGKVSTASRVVKRRPPILQPHRHSANAQLVSPPPRTQDMHAQNEGAPPNTDTTRRLATQSLKQC